MVANGYIPDAGLVTVEDNDRLIPSAAAGFRAFKAYAASQGRTLNIAEPAGAYRSYATQADMLAHPGNYGLNTASKAGLAKAGFSGHGFGDRVDLVGTSLAWIVANAGKFGFWREFGANDPNHFAHNGTIPAGGNTTPISEGFLMALSDYEQADAYNLLKAIAKAHGPLGEGVADVRRRLVAPDGVNDWFPTISNQVQAVAVGVGKIPLTAQPLSAGDIAKIADAIAAKVGTGSNLTAEAIAAATLDLQAKRLGNG